MAEDTLLLAGKLIEEMADPGAGFRERWRSQARPEQIPPEGRWRVWYLAGGRGGGKSWTGAHTLAEWILATPEPAEWGIVAPIYADAWSVCVEGESGFLAALGTTAEEVKRKKSKLVEYWHRSFAEIKLRSGHIVRVASAEDGGLRIQGKNLSGAWCVARGEPVLTEDGPVPVESVRPGVRVWTRQGWKRVTAACLTRRDARLVRVVTTGGASVRVTPDHRIWTQHAGWMEARALRYGDILSVWTSSPALPPGLSGKTSAGTAAARAVTTPTGPACSCTSPSGKASTAGACPTSTSSTMKTTTLGTTTRPTCGCSPSASTCATTTWTSRAGSGPRRRPSDPQPCANPGSSALSVNTTAPSAVACSCPRASGPCTAPPSAGWIPSRHAAPNAELPPFPRSPASGAAHPSTRVTPAPCTAVPAAGSPLVTRRRWPATGTGLATRSARSAAAASRPRTAANCSAPVPAVSGTAVWRTEPAGRADVFDLQVENAHEFTAGGILVHNCDEIGLWESWETTWDESLKYAVRKGESRIVATGTPKKSRKARKLIKRLINDPAVPVSRLRTVDNKANLSEAFLDEVVGAAKGTRLEQQELEGVLLDDVEGALWTADMIDSYRVDQAPGLIRIVVAVDPAVSNEEDSDETGIVVVGEAEGGHGFVLADWSMRGTPDACMRKAVRAYHEFSADRVIGEANNGGDYIGSLLATVDPNVPYEKVIASRGKRVRAEPVSALYEQGRVHHVGSQLMLEEQMCFPGETLVETARGHIRIDQARAGDLVMTRAGFAPLVWAGQTGVSDILATVTHESGCVKLTPCHRLYLPDRRRFASAESVQPSDHLAARPSPAFTGHPWPGTEHGGISRPAVTTGTPRANFCTGRYGRRTSALSQPAISFTTKTTTRPTTFRGTSLFELRLSTTASIPNGASGLGSWRGSSETPSSDGPSGSPTLSHALNAVGNLSRPGSGRLTVTAVAGERLTSAVPVYDLTVAPGYLPEFYANGVLVHNCSWVPSDPGDSPDRVDALVWGCAALRGLSSGSWLQAYGVKRCEDCGKAYPEREEQCPACHPRDPGERPAAGKQVKPPEPQALGGWASAYGDFVRCPACSRPYDTRRSPKCPHCTGGTLAFLRQHGQAAGISSMPGAGR